MKYKARHARSSSLAKAAARGSVYAAAVALAASGAGALSAVPAANAATTPLQVALGTLHPGDGSSADWSSTGQIDLTLGAPSSSTSAYATITPASDAVTPSTPEPTFTTDHYTAGSPRWVIQLSNGASLWGYPPNAGLNGTDFAWVANNGNTYTTWANALASAGVTVNTKVTATSIQIVADGDQAAATVDHITDVNYNGQAVGGGTVSFGTESAQNATEGKKFTLADPATTTSSDPNLAYTATGLPTGLSIDPSTGTISGTPSETGQFAVTVHATDAYGDSSNYQHFVLNVAAVAGPGYVVNVNSGKALDVAGGDFAQGGKLQQWTKGAKSPSGVAGGDQQFEIVYEGGSDYLVAVHSGVEYYVTSSTKSAQLTLSTSPVVDAVMKKVGSAYTFPGTGLVMDVKGASTANGAEVIGYPHNGQANQQWSLP